MLLKVNIIEREYKQNFDQSKHKKPKTQKRRTQLVLCLYLKIIIKYIFKERISYIPAMILVQKCRYLL